MYKEKFVIALLCLALINLSAVEISSATEKTYTNSIGMEFVLIPAGSFMMGADPDVDAHGISDETPQHKVTISKPFYMGKYEVTQAQWEEVMGSNPSKFEGRNNPVEQVSWDDAQEFIKRLNAKEGNNRYRLPTEAEWEYAARAGTGSVYFFGNDENELSAYAWYGERSYETGTTYPVGEKQPNPWGLYDIYGNVWEWVQDWYGDKYYAGSPEVDPNGPASGSSRVTRGGSWHGEALYCRSSHRDYIMPHSRSNDNVGFRLVLLK